MKKILLLSFFALLVLPIALLAQDTTAVEIDMAAIELILITGVGGFAVGTLTEMIKRALKAQGFFAYVISFAVSAAATAYYMTTAGWDTLLFIIYTFLVFAAANGFYKLVKKPNQHF